MSLNPETIADQLHSAAIGLLRQLRREDDAIGITAPRLSALSVVVFVGPLTLGELATAEQVKPPTMTRIVTGLEEDGLVDRRDDASDGRLTQIHATAKGRRILAAGRARRVETLGAAVQALDARSRKELASGVCVLQELVASMRREPLRTAE
jgi:DNA-binding MarR family transcriptional regulator